MKKVEIIIGTVFIFMGAMFSVIGYVVSNTMNRTIPNQVETEGIISNITEYDEDSDAYVTFVDETGKVYNVKSNFYSSTMRRGDKIKVYYNSKNPLDFRVDSGDMFKLFRYIFLGIGGIFVLLGLMLIVKHIKNKKHEQEIINSGIMVYGKITSVDRNNLYNVNGRFPYRIVVNFVYNNLTYEVRSDNMWNDPRFVLDSYGITELPVYIDTKNPKKSIVDFKQITDKLG